MKSRARILLKLSSLGLGFSNKGLGVSASLGFYHSPPLIEQGRVDLRLGKLLITILAVSSISLQIYMKFDQLIRQQEDSSKVGSMNSLISMFTDKFKNVAAGGALCILINL